MKLSSSSKFTVNASHSLPFFFFFFPLDEDIFYPILLRNVHARRLLTFHFFNESLCEANKCKKVDFHNEEQSTEIPKQNHCHDLTDLKIRHNCVSHR